MALTAAYVAAGSARPWFREMGVDEWPVLRDWFDKTDMQFFNAWPLKTIMVLLVANLIVVTWRRIPLTLPRYGVWCIHAGIVTLICGISFYYSVKVEGRVRIYKNPNVGPTSVDHFYDKDQRSLFIRRWPEDTSPLEIPLPTLPRFKEYDDKFGNTGALNRRGLTGIEPVTEVTDLTTGQKQPQNVAEQVGCKGQKIKLDVVGFYPYATTSTDFTIDPKSDVTGVDVTMLSLANGQAVDEWWLVGSDPRFRSDTERAMMDLQHMVADESVIRELGDAAGKLFHLDVSLPKQPVIPMDVQVGKTYPVGSSGYTFAIENFNPAFPMSGTGEMVSTLQMLVTSPTQTFRRMVIQGKPIQTDFKLNDPTGGPMGKRQKAPMDTALSIDFHIHDTYGLLPVQNSVKHLFLTTPGSGELVDIVTGFGSVASEVRRLPSGSEDIPVSLQPEMPSAPFAGGAANAAANPSGADAPDNHPQVKIHVERRDHIRPVDSIVVVPAARRDKNAEDEGYYQVAKLKVSMGDWSTIVFAPFADSAADKLRQDSWRGGYVAPPGTAAPMQFQLGNSTRPLPVRLSLDSFKLIPYPGASADSPNAMMLDFVSTVSMSDLESGESYTDVARMNHPVYYNGGQWLFFQAAYDPSAGHEWTQLGIGNRPAVGVMRAGCLMIFIGLAYAFYAKPIIIRRMKKNAIASALAEGRKVREEKKELVAS